MQILQQLAERLLKRGMAEQLSSIRKQKIEDLAVAVFNNTKRICRFLTEENT